MAQNVGQVTTRPLSGVFPMPDLMNPAPQLSHYDFRRAHHHFRGTNDHYRRSDDNCVMMFVSCVPAPSAFRENTSTGEEKNADAG